MTETQTQTNDWLKEEADTLNTQTQFDGEKLPAIQFEEDKVTEFEVDFSEKFNKWEDTENKTRKAIIPVKQGEEKKILWLNVKNPLYSELIKKGAEGVTSFKVMQTGSKKNTKYNLVKE